LNRSKLEKLHSSNYLIIILIIICVISITLSFSLYTYLTNSSRQIENISKEYVKSNSIDTVNDLKELIQNKLEVVSTNLEIISHIPLIRQQNLSAVKIFEVAQNSTKEFTGEYSWVDEHGRALWSTLFDTNMTIYQQNPNFNVSKSPYFVIPKETFKPYIEAFTNTSYRNTTSLVISYPVLLPIVNSTLNSQSNNIDFIPNLMNSSEVINSVTNFGGQRNDDLKNNFIFKGVVIASIDNTNFKDFLESSISKISDYNYIDVDVDVDVEDSQSVSSLPPSKILMTIYNKNGEVVFSNTRFIDIGSSYNSTSMIQQISTLYSENYANDVVSYIRNVLDDNGHDTVLEVATKEGTIPLNKTQFILNYQPILLNNNPELYIFTLTPFLLPNVATEQINSQIIFTFVFVSCLLVLVFSFMGAVLLLNKRLKHEVKEKTFQLKQHVTDLERNNEELTATRQSLEEINKQVIQANEKLIQNDEIQRDFINTAAHELRTPTQAILGYSEMNHDLFKDTLNDNARVKRIEGKEEAIFEIPVNVFSQLANYQKIILKNTMRLNDLANDLLDAAKLHSFSDKNKLNKERLDLIKEIQDNLQNIKVLQRVSKDKDIKIDISILANNENNEEGKYFIYADRKRLYQILDNLIGNAIKFSNSGDRINISVKKKVNEIEGKKEKANQVIVSVTDRGKGISQKVMPNLFERFATDSEYGTGLGLFITRKLVEAHGGKIWAFNNKDDKGATFKFSLPLID
jgi:signal transduction histidine kinase